MSITVDVRMSDQTYRCHVSEARLGELMLAIRTLYPNWVQINILIKRPQDKSDPTMTAKPQERAL